MNTTTATAAKTEAARIRAGVTRLALAEATGIPRPTLTRKLNGQYPLTVADIEAIALALEVDPESLVDFRAAA